MVTPLHADESLNRAALETLLERVYRAGVDGVYLCGSTGEGLLLPAAQRQEIVELAIRNSPPGKQVIVHVGAWSFPESIYLAQHAEKTGAAAISSLPPQGVSFGELLHHYRALAAATALPFLAYYFPGVSGATFSIDQMEQICAIPHCAGLKFTDYDLYSLSLLIRGGNVVLNGRDEVLCAGLLMGANGGIGSVYNLVPEWFVTLYQQARAGRWKEARATQDRVNDLIRVMIGFPFMPALKQLLTWQGIECGHALRPRMALTPEQTGALRSATQPLLPA